MTDALIWVTAALLWAGIILFGIVIMRIRDDVVPASDDNNDNDKEEQE